MRHFLSLILFALFVAFMPASGLAADAAQRPSNEPVTAQETRNLQGDHSHAADSHGEHHGLPLYATPVFNIGPFQVTNSILVSWVVAILLILFAQIATRNIRDVPQGAQNFWEWLVEGLFGFLEGIVGHHLARKTFWFFATLFILIVASNWFGLIPGVGSVGWGTPGADGELHHIARPILRGANADLNMTLAMAMVFFACWIGWALQANGPGGFIMHIFGPKGDTVGMLKILMIFVFMVVGVLEVVSILFRPVSLSFRLFGNIFAGENMLEAMAMIHPWLGWLFALPFYFMELMVGLVQALVFMLLTAVFTLLICEHDEGHGHHATEEAHKH
ncbi:MAG: F0F1 ATP synthase subunit A [Verrucomicrobiota bacterium]|nr:F0F1 ATP synthase subunit A [Verrucomicrobiota bacterium]